MERWLSWSKAHDWKSCIRGTVSRVRIPFSPPNKLSTVITVLNLFLPRERGFEGAVLENSPVESFPRDRPCPQTGRIPLDVQAIRTKFVLIGITQHVITVLNLFLPRERGFEGAVLENSPVESFPRDRPCPQTGRIPLDVQAIRTKFVLIGITQHVITVLNLFLLRERGFEGAFFV